MAQQQTEQLNRKHTNSENLLSTPVERRITLKNSKLQLTDSLRSLDGLEDIPPAPMSASLSPTKSINHTIFDIGTEVKTVREDGSEPNTFPLQKGDSKWVIYNSNGMTKCMICNIELSFWRRNNCRLCGFLCCSDCTNYKWKSHTICSNCITLKSEFKSETKVKRRYYRERKSELSSQIRFSRKKALDKIDESSAFNSEVSSLNRSYIRRILNYHRQSPSVLTEYAYFTAKGTPLNEVSVGSDRLRALLMKVIGERLFPLSSHGSNDARNSYYSALLSSLDTHRASLETLEMLEEKSPSPPTSQRSSRRNSVQMSIDPDMLDLPQSPRSEEECRLRIEGFLRKFVTALQPLFVALRIALVSQWMGCGNRMTRGTYLTSSKVTADNDDDPPSRLECQVLTSALTWSSGMVGSSEMVTIPLHRSKRNVEQLTGEIFQMRIRDEHGRDVIPKCDDSSQIPLISCKLGDVVLMDYVAGHQAWTVFQMRLDKLKSVVEQSLLAHGHSHRRRTFF